MTQQDFNLTIMTIKNRIEQYSNLPLDKKESNSFLLKTSVSDLILLLNYIIFKKGKMLGLEIKPTDSIKRKREIFNFYEEDFFNDIEQSYLSRMEEVRNKIAHLDTYFPTFEETKQMFNNYLIFQNNFSVKLKEYRETSVQLQNKCNEILSYSYQLEKFFSENQKERLLVEELRKRAKMYRNLSRPTHKDVVKLRDDVFDIFKKLKGLFAISKRFLSFLSNQDRDLLKQPMKLMKKYFLESELCPNCSSNEITQKFSKCKWIINNETYFIESFNPLKIEKKKGYSFISWYACDLMCFDEVCFKCEKSGWKAEKAVPRGSYYCENCGFFYLPGKKVGISSIF